MDPAAKSVLCLKILKWEKQCELEIERGNQIAALLEQGRARVDMREYRKLCEATTRAAVLEEITSELKKFIFDYCGEDDATGDS